MSETNDPLARVCELVGRFFYHFSRMELQLDTAIAKLFKLDPLYAPIVTANMSFMNKVYALRSALTQLGIDADATIKDIITINDQQRVVIAHGAFEPEQNGVTFTRVTAKKELKAEPCNLKEAEFQAFFQKLEQLEGDLKKIIPELEPEKVVWPPGGYVLSEDVVALHEAYRQRAARVAQMVAGSFLTPMPPDQSGKGAPSTSEKDQEK